MRENVVSEMVDGVVVFLTMGLFLRDINDNPNCNRFHNTNASCVLGDAEQRLYEGFLFLLSRYHISPQGKYRGGDKSLARPGRKEANVSLRMV